jgi:hypothetical protein
MIMRKLVFPIAALLLIATGYLLAQPTERAGHIVMTPDGKIIQKGGTPEPKQLTIAPDEGALSLRIEGEYQGRIVGTLLVRRNGKWSEVMLGGRNTFAGQR